MSVSFSTLYTVKGQCARVLNWSSSFYSSWTVSILIGVSTVRWIELCSSTSYDDSEERNSFAIARKCVKTLRSLYITNFINSNTLPDSGRH